MREYSVAGMRGLDWAAIQEYGIPGIELMTRAGKEVYAALLRFSRELRNCEYVVLAGKGNNGGDAFIVARELFLHKYPVRLFVVCDPALISGDARLAFEQLPAGLIVEDDDDFSCYTFTERSIVIDGLLGTGFSGGEIREPLAGWIRAVNRANVPVVAIDIPSGLSGDDGTADLAIRADLTVTFAGVKRGMLRGRGPEVCGRIEVADIGIPEVELEAAGTGLEVFTRLDARKFLQREQSDTYKNRRGHYGIIGGSRLYHGAPFLSAEGAMRAGAGLATVIVPEKMEIFGAIPQALIVRRVADAGSGFFCRESIPEVLDLIRKMDVLTFGPGVTTHTEVFSLLAALTEWEKPLVFDADALTLLAEHPEVFESRKSSWILTPHPGEMVRLQNAFGLNRNRSRVLQAQDLARASGCIVVLKGARTVTASPDNRVIVNLSGCPALATAGSGDVLTGVIGACIANSQQDIFEAVALGVFLHGYAGEILRPMGSRGVVGDDLPSAVARAIHEISPLA